MPESPIDFPSAPGLRFCCGGCGRELEAPLACAGVEGPCPVCGAPVRAPEAPPQCPAPSAPSPPRRHRAEPFRADRPGAKNQLRRRPFPWAWGSLVLGALGLSGAAWVWHQRGPQGEPAIAPELSAQVVDRMQQRDRQREEAVQSARRALEGLRGAADREVAAGLLMPGSAGAPGMRFPCFPGLGPGDFEFIQARRIPGTEHFLTLFEIAADPPLVVPVEQTAEGTKVHGWALAQQQGGRLGKFLGNSAEETGLFYVLLRPASPAQAAQLPRSRLGLQAFQAVALEPAVPADAATPCVICLAPDSPAGKVFAARLQDPSLRPAVVQLAWRHGQEAGDYLELLSFQPNAWSQQ